MRVYKYLVMAATFDLFIVNVVSTNSSAHLTLTRHNTFDRDSRINGHFLRKLETGKAKTQENEERNDLTPKELATLLNQLYAFDWLIKKEKQLESLFSIRSVLEGKEIKYDAENLRSSHESLERKKRVINAIIAYCMNKLQGVDILNWDDMFSEHTADFWVFAEEVLYVIQAQRLIDLIRLRETNVHGDSLPAYEQELRQRIFAFWKERENMTKAMFDNIISYTDEKDETVITPLWESYQEFLNKN